jgi:hypothetical protein
MRNEHGREKTIGRQPCAVQAISDTKETSALGTVQSFYLAIRQAHATPRDSKISSSALV